MPEPRSLPAALRQQMSDEREKGLEGTFISLADLAALLEIAEGDAELEAKATRWFDRACDMERERDAARAELEDERLAWEQQRAAYVEMRAERDDAMHGRDLARLDTENEQRLIREAWAEADRLAVALQEAATSLWAMVEQTKREGYLALSDRLYRLASDMGADSGR